MQLVVGLTKASAIGDGAERATFIAYLFTVLLVIPATIVIAIKEKTQWAMARRARAARSSSRSSSPASQQVWSLNG